MSQMQVIRFLPLFSCFAAVAASGALRGNSTLAPSTTMAPVGRKESVKTVKIPSWGKSMDTESPARMIVGGPNDGLLFTSLLYGMDMKTGKIVAGGPEKEVEQIFANLKVILAAAGKTLDQVVKTYCMLTDITDNTDALQEAYGLNFKQKPPLRYLQQAMLPHGAQAAIQFIVQGTPSPQFFADPWDPTRTDVSFGGVSGPMVYTSGFVGYDPRGPAPQPVVSSDPAAQMRQAFKNVQTSIDLAGGSIQDATDCQMWIGSLQIAPILLETFGSMFEGGKYPALTVNQVAKMRRHAKIGLVCRTAVPGVEVKRFTSVNASMPRSEATVAAGVAYTSGFFDSDASESVAAQTEVAMRQVKEALESAGSSMDSVLYCQVDVADLNFEDMTEIDTVYRRYFTGDLPARQVIQSHTPAPVQNSKVSIMCIGAVA